VRCSCVVRTSSPLTVGAWLLRSALPGAWLRLRRTPLPAASPFVLSFGRQRTVPSFVMLVSDIYLTLLSVTDAYLMILITDIWPPLRIEAVEERARWLTNAGGGSGHVVNSG
jgi:hypothetical protein